MFCSNCGKPIEEGSKFCKYCGANLEQGSKQEQLQAQSVTSASCEAPNVSTKFKLNDDGIKALISQHLENDELDSPYFYGTVTATIGQTLLFGAFSAFANKYFIFNFTKKGMHLYGISQLGKPKDYSFVPISDIKSLKMKKGMLGITTIVIEYNQGGKMKITANKHALGIKEQGQNLERVEQMFA